MTDVDLSLQSVAGVLDQVDGRLRAGSHAATRIWPTGFDILDRQLSGGFRSGDLVLLAGPQGLGKTTWALQVSRNLARSGRTVLYSSFEHDPQTLLTRLIALEAGELADYDAPNLAKIRACIEDTDGRVGSLAERLAELPYAGAALAAVQEYADRCVLHRSTGTSTTLDVLKDAVEEVRRETGQMPMLVVDYLQKVKVPHGPVEEEDRVTVVVEGLKDLAIDLDAPVLAVVAADKAGIEAGKRMRVSNLRGSSALAYEADAVLILNNKFDIVARHHLVYDTGHADRFKQWVVLSIEKNRNGKDGIDLELQKRFEQARFDARGQMVAEKLVDERVFVE